MLAWRGLLGCRVETRLDARCIRRDEISQRLKLPVGVISIAEAGTAVNDWRPGTELYDFAKQNGFILHEKAMADDGGHQTLSAAQRAEFFRRAR